MSRGKRFGQRRTYIVEVAPGPWVTADGEPILAVSSYSSPPADGRPLRDVLTIAPNDGTPATYVSFYAQGTLQTPDGRPVYATTAVSGGGASVTLNELSLSDNTWTNGSAQTVSVYGATATSTLSLVSPPSGITINSALRSLTYDGTIAAGSGSVTIRETLAGATNTPRDTVVGYTIADSGGAVLDPALTAPIISTDASSPADGSAPKINVDDDDTIDVALGYKLAAQWRDKAGTLLGTGESGTLAASPDGSDVVISNLAALAAGTRRYRYRFERTDGSAYSEWSNTLIVGPDDQEPTLSLPTATDIGATSANLGFTTDEGGPRYTVLVPLAEATPTNTQVKAGQRAAGTAAPLSFTGTATAGVNTFSASGMTDTTDYKVCTVVEDAAGNLSAVLVSTLTTAAAGTSVNKITAGTYPGTPGSTDRNQFINVPSDGLSFSMAGDIGGSCLAKGDTAMPVKAHWEETVTGISGEVYYGVAESTANFTGTGPAIGGSLPGFIFKVGSGSWSLDGNGTSIAFNVAYIGAFGTAIFEYDRTTSGDHVLTIKRRDTGGTVTTLVNAAHLTSQLPTNPRNFVGGSQASDAGTSNYGASAFLSAPTSGFAGW